jgi:hypothetical protein
MRLSNRRITSSSKIRCSCGEGRDVKCVDCGLWCNPPFDALSVPRGGEREEEEEEESEGEGR